MLPAKFVSLGDIGWSKPRSFEIGFQVILQAEEHRVREHSAARFQIRVDSGRVWRILLPMREFVAIGSQQEVHGLFHPSVVSKKTARCRRSLRIVEVYAQLLGT